MTNGRQKVAKRGPCDARQPKLLHPRGSGSCGVNLLWPGATISKHPFVSIKKSCSLPYDIQLRIRRQGPRCIFSRAVPPQNCGRTTCPHARHASEDRRPSKCLKPRSYHPPFTFKRSANRSSTTPPIASVVSKCPDRALCCKRPRRS